MKTKIHDCIAADQLKGLLQKSPEDIFIIDVRSADEYALQHIPGAVNVPVGEIESGNFIPEPGKIIITACGKGGGRSEKAANHIRTHYNSEVYFLQGGTFGWLETEDQT